MRLDQLDTPAPETRATSTVRDRDDQNFVYTRAVVDAIWKACYRSGAHFAALNPASGRPFRNPGQRAANFIEKGPAKTGPLVFVVPGGYRKFFLGLAEYANLGRLICWSTSAMTSSASRALVSPAS